jgi:hypothetical protein
MSNLKYLLRQLLNHTGRDKCFIIKCLLFICLLFLFHSLFMYFVVFRYWDNKQIYFCYLYFVTSFTQFYYQFYRPLKIL